MGICLVYVEKMRIAPLRLYISSRSDLILSYWAKSTDRLEHLLMLNG